MGGAIGWMTPTQLGDDFGPMIKGAKENAVIGPVKTYAGLHILWVRNVRTRGEKDMPTRDDIQKKLFIERVERLQNQYYLDLRSAAFIRTK